MIRFGRISYLNVLPIYYALENKIITGPDMTFVPGPPAALNRLMDQGELDIASTSSIEYARHAEKYFLVPDMAIGSCGPVQSVLLLSRYPAEELDGRTILVSSQTHTSAALLKVLLADLWKSDPAMQTGDATATLESGKLPDAILCIGDEALNLRYHPDYPVRIDLGEAWRELTGLPFIFGVWVASRESFDRDRDEITAGCRTLVSGKNWGVQNIKSLCALASESSCLSAEEMCSYFDGLVYDLGENQKKGMRQFYDRLHAHNMIDRVPKLEFVPGL